MIVGHDSVRAWLAEELPSVPVCLVGPSGIAKSFLVREAAQRHADPEDVLVVERLTVTAADGAIEFAEQGEGRIVVIDLDTMTSQQAPRRLLRTLEDPPNGSRWLLSSSYRTPDTILSRCVVRACPALSKVDTAQALIQSGASPADAERLALSCGGRPGVALATRLSMSERGRVLGLLKAVAARNWSLVGQSLNSPWSERSVDTFRLWLNEGLAGAPVHFAPGERYGLDRSVPRRAMEEAARRLEADTSPALAVTLAARALLHR